ncbi:MAG: pseudouridine synthase [Planifilum fimeticola]|jgi:23S rRNA pseudouridine2605 synthase
MERLQKVIARAGVASRRKSEELILQGLVKVNGETVTTLGVKVDPLRDRIEVGGKPIRLPRMRLFAFYKPRGVITSMSDPRGRPVVADYFRDIPERVFPVGRLDYDTEGLLLVTNDGDLANLLMHPRYGAEKWYRATVQGDPAEEVLERLRRGVRLEDGWTAPAKVRRIRRGKEHTVLELVIHEGRNRIVRRMCEAVGHPVRHLIRTRFAFVTLKGLSPGTYRELTGEEIERLRSSFKQSSK